MCLLWVPLQIRVFPRFRGRDGLDKVSLIPWHSPFKVTKRSYCVGQNFVRISPGCCIMFTDFMYVVFFIGEDVFIYIYIYNKNEDYHRIFK